MDTLIKSSYITSYNKKKFFILMVFKEKKLSSKTRHQKKVANPNVLELFTLDYRNKWLVMGTDCSSSLEIHWFVTARLLLLV